MESPDARPGLRERPPVTVERDLDSSRLKPRFG
eukprot:CAMPEP_0119510684 /NCGR_PEP_ID=MMETSP1344-20130328/29585_1 /TAXON_ID=236787 /ORGANISM="Florenciella parvula, Strain CCMP2471" /LENGTH=32 /DNA_ID= /DNA_START= /DNA_END= /DNA_ORIENTATION=